MQEAAAVRRVAREAIEDVDPDRLREEIDGVLATGSMVPGVLALLSARSVSDGHASPEAAGHEPTGRRAADPGTDGGDIDGLNGAVASRVAGVQLVYDGLRLTRRLAQIEPWAPGPPSVTAPPGSPARDREVADLDIIIADVLVARGFYLLARTEAATTAVKTVRAFGRDQTVRRETDDPAIDRNLEADVLELAVVAGTSVTDRSASPQLREYAATLADCGEFPAADGFFPETVTETVRTLATSGGASEGVTTSVD